MTQLIFLGLTDLAICSNAYIYVLRIIWLVSCGRMLLFIQVSAEEQVAVLVKEGQITDIFPSGVYELSTWINPKFIS